MGTRGQAGPGYAHASRFSSLQGGYFQPLRSAGEATLQKKSNTTQAPIKSGHHYYNPRRSWHRAEWGCAAQTHCRCLAIPESQPQPRQGWGQPLHTHCTHRTSSQLGEPSQTPSTVSKPTQFLFKVSEQKVSDGRDSTIARATLLLSKSTKRARWMRLCLHMAAPGTYPRAALHPAALTPLLHHL